LLVFAAGATAAAAFAVGGDEEGDPAEGGTGKKEKGVKTGQEETKKAKKARDGAGEKKGAGEMGQHGVMITTAWQAWQQNDVATAEAILREVPVPLQRTWEYHHLRALCRRKAMTLRGHTSGVTAVAYSPDGSHIVSGSEDRTLRVWD